MTDTGLGEEVDDLGPVRFQRDCGGDVDDLGLNIRGAHGGEQMQPVGVGSNGVVDLAARAQARKLRRRSVCAEQGRVT